MRKTSPGGGGHRRTGPGRALRPPGDPGFHVEDWGSGGHTGLLGAGWLGGTPTVVPGFAPRAGAGGLRRLQGDRRPNFCSEWARPGSPLLCFLPGALGSGVPQRGGLIVLASQRMWVLISPPGRQCFCPRGAGWEWGGAWSVWGAGWRGEHRAPPLPWAPQISEGYKGCRPGSWGALARLGPRQH